MLSGPLECMQGGDQMGHSNVCKPLTRRDTLRYGHSIHFKYLILILDRKKYSRKCKNGGSWSQSKANVKCEKDGKIKKFV